jgi:hypothetical protein
MQKKKRVGVRRVRSSDVRAGVLSGKKQKRKQECFNGLGCFHGFRELRSERAGILEWVIESDFDEF